jgi:hypothetical protein
MRAVNFQTGHADLFEILETEDMNSEAWDAFKRDLEYIATCDAMEVITIICDNQVVAFVGAKTISRGVVNVWMLPGKPFKQHKIAAHKKILELLDGIQEKNHRIQMSIRSTFKQGLDWAVALGFKQESTMAEYDVDGSSHELYVRF